MTVRETERKYESAEPPGAELIAALAAAAGGTAPAAPTRIDLSATYWDTADLRLLRSRLTLRRRVGGADAGWHLKLPAGADSRDEVRRPLGRARKPPAPLVALSRAAHRDAPLRPVVELDTVRQEWTLTDAQGEAVATVTDDGSPPAPSAPGPTAARPWTPNPSSGPRSRSSWPGRAPRRCSTGSRTRCCAPGCTGRRRPRSWAGCSPSGSRPARRGPSRAGRDGGRGRARLRRRAGRDDPRDGSAGPPRRPGGGARHARGLPADAQLLPVLPRAARPQPHRRPRRGAALARG